MDHQYPTVAKIPVLDTGKFEQWQFQIQQYLQHEHYALWEVIEFGDSYVVPANTRDTTGDDKSGRTLTLTTEDMQRKKNDAAILKTFGSNEATKKTKKNLLKQQYENFKAEGSETLEQTFNRLQVIIAKHSSRNEDGNTASVPTASTNVSTASANIDEDDMEEMDIKWNMALLSMRADKFWKKTDGVGWDWSYMENDKEDHALVADEVAPAEFALMANTSAESKDLDNLIESQRSEKNKEGLGYTDVPPPTAQLYLSPKKDLSWTDLPECADDIVTDYSRPSPTAESISEDDQNRNTSISETIASPITSKPFIKFMRAKDSQSDMRSPSRAPWVPTVNRNYSPINRKFSTGSRNFPTANRKFPTASRKFPTGSTKSITADMGLKGKETYPTFLILSHMMEDMCLLVKEDARLQGKGQSKRHNMYSIDLNNIVLHRDLTCLVAKASADECMLWHRRLGVTMGGGFRNKEMNDFCSQKRIKREFSNARTPQQNSVAKRKNRTLIEAARTMLVDAKLPVTFWAEAVNTACYVQNRVLGNKSHNKTPYELFNGRSPAIGFLKPFGCHVMILNTLDNLGKFEEKRDEGYFIGYSMSSKAFRVFNKRTRKVEENMHVEFLENKAIEKGAGPNWLFDIDSLTKSMNYMPVDVGTISTNLLGTKDATSQQVKKDVSSLRYIALPNWAHDALLEFSKPLSDARLISKRVSNQEETPSLDNILSLTNRFEDILRGTTNSDESNGEEANISNMETVITANPTPTLRIHKDHPKSQIIGHVDTLIQTNNKSKEVGEHCFHATIHQNTDPALLQFCLFSCFLSQVEPKKIFDALQDPSWVEAMQEELLQFKIQNVWTLVDCPKGDPEFQAKVYKVEKAMYGHQAPRAWYGTLSKYLLNNGFQRGTIDQTLFIRKQREDFILVQVYVDDIIFGSSNQQLCREFKALMHEKFQMSAMGELNFFLSLQVLQKKDGIFLSQDKYVGDILKKFGYSDVRSSNTPMDKENPWGKDETRKDVDLHLYRSMIGSLMYLTASRPDIMFAICACARHQVTPKECHWHAVKRIFRYLKGHLKLGLWYPKESPFDLVSFSDSDYGGNSKYWGVLRILMIGLRLIPLGEHKTDFHPMVDFIEASPLRVEISKEHAVSLFMGGLPTEIEMGFRMFKPKTLTDAYCLTNLQEATLNAIKEKGRSAFVPNNSRKMYGVTVAEVLKHLLELS
nr:uncharacterized mitochondrial protein AtMg00810-like [Tanacetum cinerariifolium]